MNLGTAEAQLVSQKLAFPIPFADDWCHGIPDGFLCHCTEPLADLPDWKRIVPRRNAWANGKCMQLAVLDDSDLSTKQFDDG